MSSSPQPVLALRNIGKRFARLSVLRAVDVHVAKGEILGLIGANGSGKTTMLTIIAGLLAPSSGERCFAEFAPNAPVEIEQRARIALVTHTAQVYPRLTAIENLEFFADLRRSAGHECAPVLAVLEQLGLGYAAKRLAGTFSRGMLQRLALARALIGKPELLLLDEPFTALDRPGRALLAEVLLLERKRGAAIMLSSHDFAALVSVSCRVVLLEGGSIAGSAQRGVDAAGFEARVQQLAGQLPQQPAQHAEPTEHADDGNA